MSLEMRCSKDLPLLLLEYRLGDSNLYDSICLKSKHTKIEADVTVKISKLEELNRLFVYGQKYGGRPPLVFFQLERGKSGQAEGLAALCCAGVPDSQKEGKSKHNRSSYRLHLEPTTQSHWENN